MTPSVATMRWGNWMLAMASSGATGAIQHLLTKGTVNGVGVSRHHGFQKGASLDFLADLEGLRGVVVQDPDEDAIDCGPVLELKGLNFLGLGTRKQPLDFSRLPNLKELRVTWNSKDTLPEDDSPLENLAIRSLKTETHDLRALHPYRCLQSLELASSGLETLQGSESLKSLKTFSAHYCSKLKKVSALAETPVEEITLESCKRVSDVDKLQRCPKLRMLALAKCAPFQSLSFLKNFATLRDFRLVETDVTDGDTSILTQLALDHVALGPKKHFSHNEAQIRAAIGKRSKTLGK